jgi:hypothetical protein
MLKEDHRLRVFENCVLRKISKLQREKVTVDWRKLHNGTVHDFYSSPVLFDDQARGVRGAVHVASTE